MKVRGVLIESDGKEYLVTVDERDLPDLLERRANGTWSTVKSRGRSSRNAKTTAQELLRGLGLPAGENHTQQLIKQLSVACINILVQRFFRAARW